MLVSLAFITFICLFFDGVASIFEGKYENSAKFEIDAGKFNDIEGYLNKFNSKADRAPGYLSSDPQNYPKRISKYYESRGVWVATVSNIDFPSQKGTDLYDEHKAELEKIVINAKNLGLNTIYFQVRPNSDALYNSDVECWSYWYTGYEGRAPTNPDEDPLRMLLYLGTQYSIDIHAWINPYRSTGTYTTENNSNCNLTMQARYPEYSFEYPPGSGANYGDPGSPDIQNHILSVVDDILNKYGPGGSELAGTIYTDVDSILPLAGIHLDDYFYPYPSNDASGHRIDIPDHDTFEKYRDKDANPDQTIEDWRRENVNTIISRLQDLCHQENHKVMFGIAPFGLYKYGSPEKIKGMSSPDDIYADTVEWLKRDIVDYLAPQLYWQDIPQDQSYTNILNYWISNEINPYNIPILAGLGTYRTDPVNGKCPPYSIGEISAQIEICREFENCHGHIHFSNKYLYPEYVMATDCSFTSNTKNTEAEPTVGSTNIIDYEQAGDYRFPSANLYTFFKQSVYNFHRSKAIPGFYNSSQVRETCENCEETMVDFQNEDFDVKYSSDENEIQILINNLDRSGKTFPTKIAIFSDYGKLMATPNIIYVANEEFNDDLNSKNACQLLGFNREKALIICNLTDLISWIPISECRKIYWTVNLVYSGFQYNGYVMSSQGIRAV